ncbi:MAG: glycoside hydrolase family 130 protein [Flavihumibacter sp.]
MTKRLFRPVWLLLFTGSALCSFSQNSNRLPDWAMGGFARPEGVNPIISPRASTVFLDPIKKKKVHWEDNDTFNPAAAVKNGKIVVLYRSEDKTGIEIGMRTSRLGYAESADGIHFTRRSEPVFYPSNDDQQEYEWPGGCEDPRVAVTEDGTYVLFYTQWNRKTPRLGAATSKDLIHWKKHGPIFQDAYNGRFFNIPHKSASILTTIKNNKQVITQINGHYFMYWGETHVFGATSTNLVDWTPVTDEKGALKPLASTRAGYFDSDLTECGPPALLTDKGIILFYNGKNNAGDKGDKRFTGNAYCAGQMLFSKTDPTVLVDRLDLPFLRPMQPFEKSGQYVNGTVFIEGMTWFNNKWFLYYGCADSKVGVAIYDPAHPAEPDPLPVDGN